MYQKLINFIKYNNAFTIIIVLFMLSFGVGYAANPDGIYASEETIISVDNTQLLSADLDNYNFGVRIISITEDETNYYAVYTYQTLSIVDGAWQNKQVEKTLTINRLALEGKDLGLYVAKELGENINYELGYLKRVQSLEKQKGELDKVVNIEYSGLIGKLFDPKEMVIEGYDAVIPEPVEEVPVAVEISPEQVIVSTPYSEPVQMPEPVISESEPTQPAQENSDLSEIPEPTLLPEPEEMIDEELVQEVVTELLTATSTEAVENATEPLSENVEIEPVQTSPEAVEVPPLEAEVSEPIE